MSKFLSALLVLLGAVGAAIGQTPVGTPPPVPPNQTILNTGSRSDRFNRAATTIEKSNEKGRRQLPSNLKPTKKDREIVAPAAADAETYRAFLKQPKTGLIRLLSDRGCQEQAIVVVADEFCTKFKGVLGASSFSFRQSNYTLGRFADVVFKNGILYTTGKMSLGFIVDLGEAADIATVGNLTPGASYVFNYQTPTELKQIESDVQGFVRTVEKDGFKYRRYQELLAGHTYLLRSVAFHRKPRTENNQPVFDDLTEDLRRDVVIAFKVIRMDSGAEGDVTILWKELRRQRVPKIDLEKRS